MVEAPPLLREGVTDCGEGRCPRSKLRREKPGSESWRRRGLVACEETRSRCGGQYLRRHAGRPRAVRYGMERGMPHVLCFLGQRIAQRGHRLNRCRTAARIAQT